MGGAVSTADDNDELVDNLVIAGYVKDIRVEQALRCVDRGLYISESSRRHAYRDLAWKENGLHLSAPCIYAKALECLNVQSGMSFLNLGSGTGYFSTVIGFLLGSYGHNYGLELNDEAVDYSKNKVAQFLNDSAFVDVADFCAPKIIKADCFLLDPIATLQQFDRIYCGASISNEHLDFFSSFLKIGGLIVAPSEDQLVVVKRKSEDLFDKSSILPVSFASMITPVRQLNDDNNKTLQHVVLPAPQPLKLIEISCIKIRRLIRNNVSMADFYIRSLLLDDKFVEQQQNCKPKKKSCKLKKCKQRSCGVVLPGMESASSRRNDPHDNEVAENSVNNNGVVVVDRNRLRNPGFIRILHNLLQQQPVLRAMVEDSENEADTFGPPIESIDNVNKETVEPSVEDSNPDCLPSCSTKNQLSSSLSTEKNDDDDDDTLKGCYLPDDSTMYENDEQSEENVVVNNFGTVPTIRAYWHRSEPEVDDEGQHSDSGDGDFDDLMANNNTIATTAKRCRTQSGYLDLETEAGEQKRTLIADQPIIKTINLFRPDETDQLATLGDHNAPSISGGTTLQSAKIDNKNNQNEDDNVSTCSSSSLDSVDADHKRREVYRREAAEFRREAETFSRKYRENIDHLLLPMTLKEKLALGRKIMDFCDAENEY